MSENFWNSSNVDDVDKYLCKEVFAQEISRFL